MTVLKIYGKKDISSLLKTRPGEKKLGENISFVKTMDELKEHPSKYVLLGIPEDIGVRANYGNAGTSKAWQAALGSLLNIQDNSMTRAQDLILLGEVDCDVQMEQAATITPQDAHFAEELGELVLQIDHKVSLVVQEIIAAGKFPIIIGGGHNNSYGNLMGASRALNSPVNCINFDAHTDFRPLEHRHSGNGFSYAFEDGFLDKYFIFGLHRNYTSATIFESLQKESARIQFNLFENISVNQTQAFSEAMEEATRFCGDKFFGIELDMDAISLMGSSAISPSGFSVEQARSFVSYFSKMANACYLHICEGAPSLELYPNQVGKTLAYLVSDAISYSSELEN